METKNKSAPQVALVTGAGMGIGFEICRNFASEGMAVMLNDLDPGLTQQAVEKINAEFPNRCKGLAGDASDTDFISDLTRQTVAEFGRLDVAVANAGITVFGDFLDYKEADFHKLVQLNLVGSFFLAQQAARQMIAQQTGGSILFMSSVTGHQAHKNLAAYGMSKAALEMLAKTLVLELSPYKINVNAVAPGATMTERTASEAGYEQTWSRITPMGRPAFPKDIAAAVSFLVSPRARHITGQSLVIDGGWTATSPSPYQE
ncbi:NAD(P)-dependent dehydrogenase, short-chain alcohol dehydrogenase family [Cyclobacterium lianum]|uniref:NAD(P)-dependent dehydrogenase, short-chain alcohol dehydrogenase family n=1 Tax=Cyclobacterium lianum TaxID=388280 RepID=A0A1M7HU15_9BACT|nr:SDR family oxidoreductase [Cyclobacterium lianum]SHM31879.1 NAD(P)-dependent dehydrogenase, short-chain alcohol dehydrogenase family [Cyclobacterium lianum]